MAGAAGDGAGTQQAAGARGARELHIRLLFLHGIYTLQNTCRHSEDYFTAKQCHDFLKKQLELSAAGCKIQEKFVKYLKFPAPENFKFSMDSIPACSRRKF